MPLSCVLFIVHVGQSGVNEVEIPFSCCWNAADGWLDWSSDGLALIRGPSLEISCQWRLLWEVVCIPTFKLSKEQWVICRAHQLNALGRRICSGFYHSTNSICHVCRALGHTINSPGPCIYHATVRVVLSLAEAGLNAWYVCAGQWQHIDHMTIKRPQDQTLCSCLHLFISSFLAPISWLVRMHARECFWSAKAYDYGWLHSQTGQ